jgi:hypothetical protein
MIIKKGCTNTVGIFLLPLGRSWYDHRVQKLYPNLNSLQELLLKHLNKLCGTATLHPNLSLCFFFFFSKQENEDMALFLRSKNKHNTTNNNRFKIIMIIIIKKKQSTYTPERQERTLFL